MQLSSNANLVVMEPVESGNAEHRLPGDYLDIQGVAELLGVTAKTIRLWIADEGLPHVRLPGGKLIRILRTSLDDWLRAREVVVMDHQTVRKLATHSLLVDGCPDSRLDRIYVRVERVGKRGFNGFISLPQGCGAAAVPLTISETPDEAVERAKDKAEVLLKQRYPRHRIVVKWTPN